VKISKKQQAEGVEVKVLAETEDTLFIRAGGKVATNHIVTRIKSMAQQPLFEIDESISPPSCLPVGLDMSSLVDITAIGDSWRKYLHTESSRVYDCAEYYRLSQQT
jgi:hypothetical protein